MCRYANFAIAQLESDGIINEAMELHVNLTDPNKKISLSTHKRDIDNVLVYIFLKSLLTVPSSTKAYKLGLIDNDGNLKRAPKTDEENDAISNLDLLMAKLRKWLSPHLQKMSALTWTRSAGGQDRVQNALTNASMLVRRAYVLRANNELYKILGQK